MPERTTFWLIFENRHRWVDAADLGELWEGDVLDVEVAGEHVLLVRLLGGEVRAYQGLCPHQEMLLADGDFDADSGVLVCMGHLWEFDLRAGAGINPYQRLSSSIPACRSTCGT